MEGSAGSLGRAGTLESPKAIARANDRAHRVIELGPIILRGRHILRVEAQLLVLDRAMRKLKPLVELGMGVPTEQYLRLSEQYRRLVETQADLVGIPKRPAKGATQIPRRNVLDLAPHPILDAQMSPDHPEEGGKTPIPAETGPQEGRKKPFAPKTG